MTDMKNWSEVSAENSGTPPDGWPEGMKRSDVNNSAREMMRAAIDFYRNAEWVTVYVTTGDAWLAAFSAAAVVKLVPQDGQTTIDISSRFPAGSRIKLTGGAAAQYGFVVSAALSVDDTLVTVVIDDASAVDASTDLMEIGVVRDLLAKTAYYPTGTTLAQTPPQIPTIDDLGDQVLLNGGHDPEGDSSAGIDADTVDGLHAADLVTSSSAAGANVVINGGMAIWQRGITIDSSTTNGRIYTNDDANYCADRWRLLSGLSTGSKDDLVVVSHDDTDAPTGQYRSMKFVTQSYAANDRFGIFQVLSAEESAALIGSGSVSMGVDCLGNGTLAGIRFQILGWDGGVDHANLSLTPISDWGVVGGSLTYATNWSLMADSGTKAITTAWSRETFENEDISAPPGMQNIGILIYADSVWATTNTLNITGVRVENSSAAAAFNPRPYINDLLECQRTFNTTFDRGEDPRHAAGLAGSACGLHTNASSDQGIIEFRFPVEMRAIPTITTWNPITASPAANENVYAERSSQDVDISTRYVEYLTRRVLMWFGDNPNPQNTAAFVHLTADADL